MSGTAKKPVRIWLILSIVIIGGGVLYYAALSPESFGRAHDDSIYVTTAKALATGDGYRIISLPYEPAQTKYPPLYPFLLSLVWRLFPEFPENLVPMMIMTIVATLSFLAASYFYITRKRYSSEWQAVIVLALAALNWRTVALVATLYSEMVYAILSVLALYLTEDYDEHDRSWGRGILAGVVIGLTFLTRSLGVTLLIALAIHSIQRRRLKPALVPLAVGGAFVVGWAVWCYLNRTTADGSNVAYYTDYVGHINQVVTSLHLQSGTPKLLVLLGLVGRNMLMFLVISPVVVILGIDYGPAQYLGFVSLFFLAGFIRQVRQEFRLLHIYMLCYLLMASFVPFPAYDRYLIPILPFVLMLMVSEASRSIALIRDGFARNGGSIKRVGAVFVGLALVISAAAILYNHGSEILQRIRTTSFRKTTRPAPEDSEAIAWINQHASSSDVLVCYHDPAYFLYTGRKSARSLPMEEWVDWRENQGSMETVENLVFRTLERDNAGYLILTSADFEAEDQTGQYQRIFSRIIDSHPDRFTAVFNSSDGRSRIFRVKNPE